MPGHQMLALMPAAAAAVAIAQEQIRLEEELRDGAAGARIDLALQVFQVRLDAAGFGMTFRIRRHRHFEIPDLLQSRCTKSDA